MGLGHRVGIVLDVGNLAIISGIVLTLPKLIKHPKLEEVDMVEGTEMEDVEDIMEMEDEEEEVEQMPKLMLSTPKNPLWQM